MNDSFQEETSGIDEQMALAPVHFLRAVMAAPPPFSVVFTD
jgi:hypothetical protein